MFKIKKKTIILTIIIFIVATIIGGIFFYKSIANSPLSISDETLNIEVKSGEGFNSLLSRLDEEGALRSKLFIQLKLKIDNYNPRIISGNYMVNKDVTLEELVKTLETEDTNYNQVSVTIPEGFNIENIAEDFEKAGLFPKADFINAVKSYPLPSYVKENKFKKYNLEGYLYPDTYFFKLDAKPSEVIDVMVKKFEAVLAETLNETGKNLKQEETENLIIKASLIEKEVKLDKERSKVASVIENRLSKGMKLEFCSTVNYVIGYEGHEILTYKDIAIDSPFNTYKNTGLPIGPVASPGKNSIKAALVPEQTDFLYFVLTEDNESHHFSKTEKEHEAAKLEAEAKRKANKENK